MGLSTTQRFRSRSLLFLSQLSCADGAPIFSRASTFDRCPQRHQSRCQQPRCWATNGQQPYKLDVKPHCGGTVDCFAQGADSSICQVWKTKWSGTRCGTIFYFNCSQSVILDDLPLLHHIEQGTDLLKHGRLGKPKMHFFRLAESDSLLTWRSANGKPRGIPLASVKQVTGCGALCINCTKIYSSSIMYCR